MDGVECMIPLIIKAIMSEPVCYYGDGLHLDGPLAFAVFQDLDVETRNNIPPITSSWAVDFDLPLERWEVKSIVPSFVDKRLLTNDGKLWGWKTSAVFADWIQHDGHIITRQPNILELSRWTTSPSVNVGAGQLKAVSLKLPTMLATELKWWVVGDPDKIFYLLNRYIPAIGKLHNKGLGQVLEWEIIEAEEDRSIKWNNIVTRVMPENINATGFSAVATIRPPYHHRSRSAPALLPPHCYSDLMEEIE